MRRRFLLFMSSFIAAGMLAAPALGAENAVTAALLKALQDERQAEAFYAAVIEKHGPVRPFSNIIEAERRHAT